MIIIITVIITIVVMLIMILTMTASCRPVRSSAGDAAAPLSEAGARAAGAAAADRPRKLLRRCLFTVYG